MDGWARGEDRTSPDPCRRRLCKLGLFAAAACLVPSIARAAGLPAGEAPRRLAFFNTHTGETLEAVYYRAGGYDPAALRAIHHILRDHRSGCVHPIDPALLDLLHALGRRLGRDPRWEVISGYRSPETNALLRSRSRGVASGSLHTAGKAIDVRIDGLSCLTLRNEAAALAAGGVGYYPASNFVHLDVGRVRCW